jgi:hypothetical protein
VNDFFGFREALFGHVAEFGILHAPQGEPD